MFKCYSLCISLGSFCGSLSSLTSVELGTYVIKELLHRTQLDPSDVSEVIMGQILLAGVGQNPARQAAVKAEIPFTVPAYTVNQLCGSGLKSIVLGYQTIKTGDASIVICGGQESMSQAPHCMNMRSPVKMGNATMKDTLQTDALTDAFLSISMGITAENVANDFNISRKEQDIFSTKSQNKAEQAQKLKYFQKEIVPVQVQTRKEILTITEDEFPRHGTTCEALEKLRPAFIKDGKVTAGNSSGINDGAAGVVLMNFAEAKKRNLLPIARVVGYAEAGVEPRVMGIGPIPAIRKLMKKIDWSIEDVDLFELNEAFAAQSIAVMKELGIQEEKVNIHGGAIALGHPVGASGARVLVTLVHALQRTGKRKGVASLCIGGGMGIAIAVEIMKS